MNGRRVLNVSEITNYLRGLFEQDGRLANVWVKGEVANLRRHSSGHLYFSLRDQAATLRSVFFSGLRRAQELKLADGQEVIARGYIAIYPRDGAYQLYTQELFPAGAGAWQQLYSELKAKLQAEGLLDPARKRPLPFLPRCVGVITSPDGAALADIVAVLRRRFPALDIALAPVTVQGEAAPAAIANALAELNREPGIDVIILGRGGGASEDLAAFNTEAVARAVYASSLPVVTAVGHATDTTLADLVADVHAPTPSAAAELVAPDRAELARRLATLATRLDRAVDRRLALQRARLEALAGRRGLDRVRHELYYRQQALDGLERRLAACGARFLERRGERLKHLGARLEAASPVRVLARGYAVCRKISGAVVSDYRQVSLDEAVEVLLKNGALRCRVEAAGEGEGWTRS